MRQLNHDYLNSNREPKDQYYYLNNGSLTEAVTLKNVFLEVAYDILIDGFNKNIED